MWQLNRLRDSIDDHPKGKTVKEVLDNYQSRGFRVVSDNLLPVVMTFTIPDVRDLQLCYPWSWRLWSSRVAVHRGRGSCKG